jgi:type I restriction enzyme M protein
MSLSSFLWSIADLLRGDYKRSEFGRAIQLFTIPLCMGCLHV